MKRIIFMGSPEFSIHAFEAVSNHNGYDIVALYCQPDRKSGRGQKISAPSCKEFAIRNAIPVYQPDTLRAEGVFENYRELKPDLTLVSAYGKILPEKFITLPTFRAINIHASLLPRLRGAAPINLAIVRGDKKTGITIINMTRELDSGDILFQKEISIGPAESAQELHDRLSKLAGEIIVDVLEKIFRREITGKPQEEGLATYAPMLKKGDGKIDFGRGGREIFNLIRGFSPWPGSYCTLHGKPFKILEAELADLKGVTENLHNGTIFDLKEGLVKLADSVLRLKIVQIEGKKALKWNSFVCGFKFEGEQPLLK